MKHIILALALVFSAAIARADSTSDLMALGVSPAVANYLGEIVSVSTAGVLQIRADTVDATDTASANISGGGAIVTDGSRGATLFLRGNEFTGEGGYATLIVGQGGIYDVLITPTGTATPASAFKIANDKSALFAGTVRSSATGSLGWSVVAGANAACTATCTSAAVFGFDLAAGPAAPTIVSAGDASADVCLCSGAN